MKIDDYKKLFEVKHEEGWLDENIWLAKCKICGKLTFDKYLIKNWYNLDGDKRKKKFYAAIKYHINTFHSEMILYGIKKLEKDIPSNESLHFLKNFPFRPLKEEKLKKQDIALGEALHFLKNFPFRPIIEKLTTINRRPSKRWKPGIIALSLQQKQNKESI